MRELLVATPISFMLGVAVGLWLASRFRIVKRPEYNGKTNGDRRP